MGTNQLEIVGDQGNLTRDRTDVNPTSGMKLLDGLSDTPKDLFPFLRGQLLIFFDQGKQSASEVWVDQDTLLLVGVDVHAQPLRARIFGCKAKGLVVEWLGDTLEDEGFVVGPECDVSAIRP
jgi:hypothetical protein